MQKKLFILSFVSILISSCSKLVDISEPINTITTSETFASDANAGSAIANIYYDLSIGYNQNFDFGNGLTTVYSGMSADELNYFDGSNTAAMQFQFNTLTADNTLINSYYWTPLYHDIFLTNLAIEGIGSSKGMSATSKKQLMGESKFLRAFCYFYLVNFFGDVPLVTSSAWATTGNLPRTPAAAVYTQIVSDLTDAQNLLNDNYDISQGARIRANQDAATALLARTYLYTGEWAKAEAQSSTLINNTSLFQLTTSPNDAFLKDSPESILQWQVSDKAYPYATLEANNIIPYDSLTQPNFFLTPQLLSAFEPGDQRKTAWIDSSNYSGVEYYYPFKYKILVGEKGNVLENYVILRLAEQYLIRAEAEARQNKTDAAIADLNSIRTRAGLPNLPTLTPDQLLSAVYQERRIELFAEWGHRWFDLKRTGQASQILSSIKPAWKDFQQLYPIPAPELVLDPNMSQNTGY